MADNQPRDFDVVLGGEAAPPVTGMILGGIEGVKTRLSSSSVDVRVAALSTALNYGDAGLDLIIEALDDSSPDVQNFAVKLLKEQAGIVGKQVLLEYNPWLFFTKLENWKFKNFNSQTKSFSEIGIAYEVNLEQLKLLLQHPQANQIEALVCNIYHNDYPRKISNEFYEFVDTLFNASKILTNLKALFLGDIQKHKEKKSVTGLGDISRLLEAYPKLEVLNISGYCEHLECHVKGHENLKTFIIETANISDLAINQICSLNLPALEYFELWMGSNHELSATIKSLKPVFFGESFPNLNYLGLCNNIHADEIASAIHQSSFMADYPIIDNLAILDLSKGHLTDYGLETLLECPAISSLYCLRVRSNYLSEELIKKIEDLSLIDGHFDPGSRYWALYE
ncbi:hypothetical protein DSM106972_088940 [Dulcicalothrix desertica PCC 7102]|uniref:Uncharacterized protein n=1 Tax=Dulcicalothrix desertica PCC 7102 TaxID=232991 RepID=A0A433UPW3_9CYAN|nr:HEAT repeat domain-containing protein [Dulcicalothrix desertica]RUS95881.1 hypothetical protein DSM106972_088940 [Dulcicalothrix desertica PCC 7102]TWH39518.1 hypothetical protein CAL7102_08759 [Dulcicalothrix desertica PCC 7102]